MPGKRAQLARLRDERLQVALGRENPVDFGEAQTSHAGGRGFVQIILISDRLAKARSMTLSLGHLFASAFLMFLLIVSATAGVYWLTLRYGSGGPPPALRRLVLC